MANLVIFKGFSNHSAPVKKIQRGFATALVQLGFVISITFVNNLASSLGGITAVSAFSACLQTMSFLSIFAAGIIESYVPLVAMMYSQEDWTGIRLMMDYVMKVQAVINILFTVIVEIFPAQILYLFGIKDEALSIAIPGLRIFAITFLFRAIYLFYKSYYQVIDRKLYAVIICLLDGFVLSCPLTFIMAKLWGLTGMWVSFPLLSVILLAGIFVANKIIEVRSNGKYVGPLLIKRTPENEHVYECTFNGDTDGAVEESQRIQAFCKEHNVDKMKANFAALAAEEISVYTVSNTSEKVAHIDMIIRIRKNYILLIFRSEGTPFNWIKDIEKQGGNVWLVNKISQDCKYDYVMGMNLVKLKVTES